MAKVFKGSHSVELELREGYGSIQSEVKNKGIVIRFKPWEGWNRESHIISQPQVITNDHV